MKLDTLQTLRQRAIDELEQHGIRGPSVYLIDIIPLIEMIWADGRVQEGELEILKDFLHEHVSRINRVAGYQVLTYGTARDFVLGFLRERPQPQLLKTLRSLIVPLRMASSEDGANQSLRNCLLAACLDIAASSVREYPYGIGDRFNPEEKTCLFEILDSFAGLPHEDSAGGFPDSGAERS
jgi:hypothetical protein